MAADAIKIATNEFVADYVRTHRLDEMPYALAKRAFLVDFQAAYVAKLLEETNGNRSAAARRARMERSGFMRLIRKVRASGKAGVR